MTAAVRSAFTLTLQTATTSDSHTPPGLNYHPGSAMDVTTHPHVSVENVERTTADALVLGATLVDTTDVPGLGAAGDAPRPEGALFGLWQPAPRQGAVDDCNAAIERAKTIGGSPVFVHTVPKHGRIGSLRDPGGAMFVIRGPVHSQT